MKKISEANFYSYVAYREKVTINLQDKLVTEPEDHLIQYIQLNEVRMNRLDKTINLTEKSVSKLQSLTQKYTFYVLSEGWCGDAAQIVPVIAKMADASELIDLKIIFRDENLEIMNQYLTNGTQSIPKLIVVNEKGEEVAIWGPRPEPAAKIILEDKLRNGKVTDEGKTALQLWYAKNKGEVIQDEILSLLK